MSAPAGASATGSNGTGSGSECERECVRTNRSQSVAQVGSVLQMVVDVVSSLLAPPPDTAPASKESVRSQNLTTGAVFFLLSQAQSFSFRNQSYVRVLALGLPELRFSSSFSIEDEILYAGAAKAKRSKCSGLG